MSQKDLTRYLNDLKKRLSNNEGFRRTSGPEPHVLSLSKEYLKVLGFSDTNIKAIYDVVDNYVKRTNPKGKNATIKFDKEHEFVFFMDTKEDNLAKTSRIVSKINEVAKKAELDIKLEAGHTLTANMPESIGRKIFRTKREDVKPSLIGILKKAEKTYKNAVIEEFKERYSFDVNIEYYRQHIGNIIEGKFLFLIFPQTVEFNQKVVKDLEDEFKKTIEREIDTLKGSKSYLELLEDDIENAFLGKPRRRVRIKSTAGISIRPKVPTKVTSTAPIPTFKGTKRRFANELALRNLINKNLHDQIKKNMGKGDNMEILNYRTGRFARSAKVTSISQGKSGMFSFYYTYMRSPYDTFLPGGRLYKPGRNPKHIIGKSIRELAAQVITDRFKTRTVLT